MTSAGPLTYFCFRCYARNPRPEGVCAACGDRVEAPPGTGYDDLLLWALRHPVRDVALRAAETLGARRVERAARPLRSLAQDDSDPYLAAAALRSLLVITGSAAPLRELLEERSVKGSLPVRNVARRALTPEEAREGLRGRP